ncbi:MAG: sigma-70 family RNA polymerase sigma factor [Anaerolineales bacterium]|jgi:RNA polymerase sigma-70 factor (ECF subfamily)
MVESKISDLSDAELIARAQAGEVAAFGEIYERHMVVIYRYVLARVNAVSDAEDLTEIVFLRAFEALHRYKERGRPFTAFLYQVARNALVDHYREQRKSETIEAVERLPSSSPAPDEQLLAAERRRVLREALSELPSDYQEVIRLRIMLSLPTAMVGEWLGRSEGAVRVLLHRALKALRQRMVGNDV